MNVLKQILEQKVSFEIQNHHPTEVYLGVKVWGNLLQEIGIPYEPFQPGQNLPKVCGLRVILVAHEANHVQVV